MTNTRKNLEKLDGKELLNNQIESKEDSTSVEKKDILSSERKEREVQTMTIENFVTIINEKLLKLLSDNNDLLYNIQNKINKIPGKEDQLFGICWIIRWEMEKYFKGKNIFYERILKPFLDKYQFSVNLAKQKMNTAKFCEFYSDLVKKIENIETETPKPTNNVYYADKKTFRPSV